ncbi:Gypsy retrotransposon integrase-like protein 1 [Oopsacas minuta]|uniref:Gypsy retrotransposon integrase-like protein 1 n=1 Tax=Oopsacas minuta TaxID=111878 RepID=A0AAV7K492_9METZ|nr:Gypsy retrotransposon integrase-like protein 1 [Oopsacas minuta]
MISQFGNEMSVGEMLEQAEEISTDCCIPINVTSPVNMTRNSTEHVDYLSHIQSFSTKIFQEFNRNLRIDNRSTRAYHQMANGLVEVHNKILKMKLNKMGRQTSKEWSILLKSAVLSMNSTKKRSTGQTPFKIMWGRESQFIEEEEVFARLDLDNLDDLDDPSLDTLVLEEERFNIYDSASQSIASEQLKQKSQYDKKVTGNRKPIVKGDMFMFTNIPKMKKMPNTKKQPKYLVPHMSSGTKAEKTIKTRFRRCRHQKSAYIDREGLWVFLRIFIGPSQQSKGYFRCHIQNGTYLTCVHKVLHEMFHQNHKYVPNTFLFTFLKDISEYDMKRQIRETLLCWSHIFYPKFGDLLAAKYTESVHTQSPSNISIL